jgi:hypothetical protein
MKGSLVVVKSLVGKSCFLDFLSFTLLIDLYLFVVADLGEDVVFGYAAVLTSLGFLSEAEQVLRGYVESTAFSEELDEQRIVSSLLPEGLAKLSSVLKARGKLVEAREMYIKLLNLQTHRMGLEDPEVLGTMNVIA